MTFLRASLGLIAHADGTMTGPIQEVAAATMAALQHHKPAYQGHLPDGSSVQQHSAGSQYPYVVQVRENVPENKGTAEVVDSLLAVKASFGYPLDDKAKRLEAYGDAYEAAEWLAATHELAGA